MIPILYENNEKDFKSQGIGRLVDAHDISVKWELNSTYEMSFEYPAAAKYFSEIKNGRIVYAMPFPGADPQAFRIYQVSRNIDRSETVSCEHISYLLNHIPVLPFSATTAQEAVQYIKTNAAVDCPFSLSSELSETGEFSFEEPKMARTLIGGTSSSILSAYGGELLWDNYNVSLKKRIGSDSGVTLRYGKNLTDLKQDENIQSTVTGVLPYYKSDESFVTLPEKILECENASAYPYGNIEILNCTDAFDSDTVPTADSIRTYARQWLSDNNAGVPSVSLSVSFVNYFKGLDGVGKYGGYKIFEEINPGDTIGVFFEEIGVNTKAEVVGYSFDVLEERYTNITVGDPEPDLAVTLANRDSDILFIAESVSRNVGTATAASAVEKSNTYADSAAASAVEKSNAYADSAAASAVAKSAAYQKAGKKTITFSDESEKALLSLEELDEMFGLNSGTCSNENTIVTAANADAAITTQLTATYYSANAWNVKFAEAVTGDILLTYTAQYFGDK